MLKKICLFIFLWSYLLPLAAQTDPAKKYHTKVKKRASAYDTTVIYFNKWKLNFCLDIGYMSISPSITGSSNYPGILGIISPSYNETILPSYNFSGAYGVTEKSAIGVTFNFQQTTFSPAISSPELSSGNIGVFQLKARYLHCMGSWKHFYWGAQYGVLILQNNYNPNTFTYAPPYTTFFSCNTVGFFIGARFLLMKNVWFHCEQQEDIPIVATAGNSLLNEQFGINYTIDTRSHRSHKPVKMDPVLLHDSLKRYYIKVEDSAKARSYRLNKPYDYVNIPNIPYDTIGEKHKRSVRDSLSPFYNKGKLNISLETGNSDMDVVALSMFGTISPGYNQHLLPLLSICGDYGIRPKSEIGMDFMFMQVNYTPVAPGLGLSSGGVSAYSLEARYLHCMWSWRYFYYGFKLGVIFWNPHFNSNTFYNTPSPQPLAGINGGLLLGAHITLVRNLLAHFEIQATEFAAVDFGLTYQINKPHLIRR